MEKHVDAENVEVITMTKERFDQIMERLEALEKSNNNVASQIGSYNNAQALTPVYRPAPKKSGWETVGKMALGAGITALAFGIVGALTGGNSGGGTNTFGGTMPG